MTTPRRLLIDCDPGHDDAIALLLAHGSPALELVGVTTVAGNHSVENTTANAQSVAVVGGFTHVPIARGAARPLMREAQHAESIHGASGMDGPARRDPGSPLDPRSAAQFIVDTVMAAEPGEITLVPMGALTNVALAGRIEPRIVARVREVVFMGGAVAGGNWTATAEFNVWADPEAAKIVLGEAWPVTMIGLDVTHQVLADEGVLARIRDLDTGSARFVLELVDFFGPMYTAAQRFAAPPIHDAVAVAAVLAPQLFRIEAAPLDVVTADGPTLGMTIADLRPGTAPHPTHRVALDVDADGVWDLIVGALARLP